MSPRALPTEPRSQPRPPPGWGSQVRACRSGDRASPTSHRTTPPAQDCQLTAINALGYPLPRAFIALRQFSLRDRTVRKLKATTTGKPIRNFVGSMGLFIAEKVPHFPHDRSTLGY
jgi:hypothetical protein